MSLYIIFGAKRQKMSNANGDNNNVAGEILPETLPAKERSRVSAKVPDIERRTSNTLHLKATQCSFKLMYLATF